MLCSILACQSAHRMRTACRLGTGTFAPGVAWNSAAGSPPMQAQHLSGVWCGSGGVRQAVHELRGRVRAAAAAALGRAVRQGCQVLQRADSILHREAVYSKRAPDRTRRAPAPALAAVAVWLPAASAEFCMSLTACTLCHTLATSHSLQQLARTCRGPLWEAGTCPMCWVMACAHLPHKVVALWQNN